MFAQGPLWYLLMRLQYGMDMKQYADLWVSWSIRSILTNLVLLPLLVRRLEDTTLILLSTMTTALAFILTSLGTTVLYVMLVGILFLFYRTIEKISTSLLSKLVQEHEVGLEIEEWSDQPSSRPSVTYSIAVCVCLR